MSLFIQSSERRVACERTLQVEWFPGCKLGKEWVPLSSGSNCSYPAFLFLVEDQSFPLWERKPIDFSFGL